MLVFTSDHGTRDIEKNLNADVHKMDRIGLELQRLATVLVQEEGPRPTRLVLSDL